MVSADVSQLYFLWHVPAGTMLGWPIILKVRDSVQSLGVVTSLPTGVTQGTFKLALYRNGTDTPATTNPTPTPAAPGLFVVATDDIQAVGGDNICTNNIAAMGALAGGVQYAATTTAYYWVTLLVTGNDDVVIVGRNAAILEPTWCASTLTLPPAPAPTSNATTLANCAPQGRITDAGMYNGAIPHLFVVVSPG